jgi:hypothetical protein
MIVSIMNASGSALPSEHLQKKNRSGTVRPAHRFAVENATKLRTLSVFPLRLDWNPLRQHATASALLPAWRDINLNPTAQRSSVRRRARGCAFRFRVLQNGFQVDCGVNLR